MRDTPPVQLRLAEPLTPRAGRDEYRRALASLDQFGAEVVTATASIDLEQQGGRYARPKAFMCSDGCIYWVKSRAQTGLCAELIANRLAHMLGIGPVTRVVRLDPFLAGTRDPTSAVGTQNMNDVIPSKQLIGSTQHPLHIDAASWAQVAVYQSWIDLMDQQVLVGTKSGLVYSFDHGEAFRHIVPGPPRFVLAQIPGAQLDWSVGSVAALQMTEAIEALSPIEILEATAGIPDEPGWQGAAERRVAIGRWLIKRRPLLRREVMTWSRTVD